jgi:hypothetical protein
MVTTDSGQHNYYNKKRNISTGWLDYLSLQRIASFHVALCMKMPWNVSLRYQLSQVRSFGVTSDSSEIGQWPYLFMLKKKDTGVTYIYLCVALQLFLDFG